ncbi:MAG TPA: polyprenyl synthetase family protein [Acidimicrobiia bacterium]|nr:polyprenyl synthetase family protein [Acidimicrobiia bacterium]
MRPNSFSGDTPEPPGLPKIPAAAVPPSLAAVAPPVEARIDALLDEEAARWGLVDPELVPPIEALRRFVLDGGKRLRPAFCHWAYVGAGGEAAEPAVIDAGAALELLHAFALLHDDVMDGSSLRRGRPTVHVDFAARHGDAGWRGEARRFGEGVAILVGDLAFVYADLLMVGVPAAATAIFNELRVELNIGQALDLIGAAEARRDLPMARRIATYKSGKYTIERPLHLGAALMGRLDDLAEPLSAYGLPLGEAFQMRDDVLGTFGDPDLTGKPVGEDLREGKPTPLLAITTARAGAAGSGLLERVGAPDLGDHEVAAIQALMVETGAKEETERLVDELAAEAVAALDKAALTVEARAALTELAAFVAHRDR